MNMCNVKQDGYMPFSFGEFDCVVDKVDYYLEKSPAVAINSVKQDALFRTLVNWAQKSNTFALSVIFIHLESLLDQLC